MIAAIRNWEWPWLLAAILVVLLNGCRVTGPLPDADIVFQTMTETEDREPRSLGFVDADGSDLEYVEIPSPGWMLVFPAQTSDGDFLIFRESRVPRWGPSPLSAIMAKGRLIRYDEDFNGPGRIAPVQNSHQVVIAEPFTGGLPKDIQDHIQLVDLERKVVAQTYVTTTGGIWLNVGSNALHGVNLVYVRGQLVDDKYPVVELVSLNTETEVETVLVEEEGGYPDTPAISPDGQQVAYTVGDGIYVVSSGGGEPRRVVETCVIRKRQSDGHTLWDNWSPAPSWSPDSQWLVYHRCTRPCPEWCSDIGDYSIFKVNVETGEEVLLIEGGLNPYWRLGPTMADGP